MAKKKIELGNKVKDVVSGFTGIASWKTEYLNGCVQIGITGKANAAGEVRTTESDIEQVAYVGIGVRNIVKPPKKVKKKTTGGPSRYSVGSRML